MQPVSNAPERAYRSFTERGVSIPGKLEQITIYGCAAMFMSDKCCQRHFLLLFAAPGRRPDRDQNVSG